MNDNGDNIVKFPTTRYEDLVITIVQDKERNKAGIVILGFNSVEDAEKFLEEEDEC
jgi:hypothetical protein